MTFLNRCIEQTAHVCKIGFQFHFPSKKDKILGEKICLVKIMFLYKNHKFLEFSKVYCRLQRCIISILKPFLERNATVSGDKRIKKTWCPTATISTLGVLVNFLF